MRSALEKMIEDNCIIEFNESRHIQREKAIQRKSGLLLLFLIQIYIDHVI